MLPEKTIKTKNGTLIWQHLVKVRKHVIILLITVHWSLGQCERGTLTMGWAPHYLCQYLPVITLTAVCDTEDSYSECLWPSLFAKPDVNIFKHALNQIWRWKYCSEKNVSPKVQYINTHWSAPYTGVLLVISGMLLTSCADYNQLMWWTVGGAMC